MKNQRKDAGFAAIELIIVVLLLGVIGIVGYQAWQTNHNKASQATSATPTPTSRPTATPVASPTPTVKYFTIKEWGIKAPVDGTDQLSYTLSGGVATVISRNLAEKYATCTTYGAGQIRRLAPTDGAYADGLGPTAADYAQQNPGSLSLVGGYYYMYVHDQAVCSTGQSVTDQNQANTATKSLVANFQAAN